MVRSFFIYLVSYLFKCPFLIVWFSFYLFGSINEVQALYANRDEMILLHIENNGDAGGYCKIWLYSMDFVDSIDLMG